MNQWKNSIASKEIKENTMTDSFQVISSRIETHRHELRENIDNTERNSTIKYYQVNLPKYQVEKAKPPPNPTCAKMAQVEIPALYRRSYQALFSEEGARRAGDALLFTSFLWKGEGPKGGGWPPMYALFLEEGARRAGDAI